MLVKVKMLIVELNKHLNTIKNSKIFENKTYSEVSEHFKDPNHNVKKHFKFIIINDGLNDKFIRLNYENDFIQIIKYITGKILNKYIPNIYKMKSLTF